MKSSNFLFYPTKRSSDIKITIDFFFSVIMRSAIKPIIIRNLGWRTHAQTHFHTLVGFRFCYIRWAYFEFQLLLFDFLLPSKGPQNLNIINTDYKKLFLSTSFSLLLSYRRITFSNKKNTMSSKTVPRFPIIRKFLNIPYLVWH